VRGGLALALHATRSASPASELRVIEANLKTGGADGEATTVKEIAAQTGMSIQTVRRRLRLRSLTPALRDAFNDWRITASVTEPAARLPECEHHALADQLAEGGRLTLPDVSEVARRRSERTRPPSAEHPNTLIATHSTHLEVTPELDGNGSSPPALLALPRPLPAHPGRLEVQRARLRDPIARHGTAGGLGTTDSRRGPRVTR
jgi:hypothetical protein